MGSFNGMTRVDDHFVVDVIDHTSSNNEPEEAREIIKGFWGFVEVTYPLPRGGNRCFIGPGWYSSSSACFITWLYYVLSMYIHYVLRRTVLWFGSLWMWVELLIQESIYKNLHLQEKVALGKVRFRLVGVVSKRNKAQRPMMRPH